MSAGGTRMHFPKGDMSKKTPSGNCHVSAYRLERYLMYDSYIVLISVAAPVLYMPQPVFDPFTFLRPLKDKYSQKDKLGVKYFE